MTSVDAHGRGDSLSSSEDRAKSIFGLYGSSTRPSEDSLQSNGRLGSMLPYSSSHKSGIAERRMERVEELATPIDPTGALSGIAPGSGLERSSSAVSSRSRRSARVVNGRLSDYPGSDNANTDHTARPLHSPASVAPPLPGDFGYNIGQGRHESSDSDHAFVNGFGDGLKDVHDHERPFGLHDIQHGASPSSSPPRNGSIRHAPFMASATSVPPGPNSDLAPSETLVVNTTGRANLFVDENGASGSGLQARERDPTGTDSMASGWTRQGVGEEDDAFHVRSTYARLEVQGVYGDGWTEGVERTRERAGVSHSRRKSLVPRSKDDPMMDEEIRVLSTVDRYGFFDQTLKTRSEHRLVLLTTSSLSVHPKIPSRPPKRAATIMHTGNGLVPVQQNGNGSTGDVPNTTVPPEMLVKLSARAIGKSREKEGERISKWERMLKAAEKDRGGNVLRWGWEKGGKGKKLTERVYKGIPDRWRAAGWWAMMTNRMAGGGDRRKRPSLADSLRSYEAAMDIPSTYDVQIDLDVPRTISGHVLFHTRYGYGQRSLFHVLHCFSLYCSTCGYCQGMGPIAATLLTYFDAGRTYAALVRLHDAYRMHSMFEPGFPGLLESFYVQERLLEHLMPEVYTAFERNMISSSSYATKWYITLFANTVPYQTQLRIWDILWLEGSDVLVVIAIAIIWSLRESLSVAGADFELLLSNLSAFYVPEDEDALLIWASKLMAQKALRVKMVAWRNAWTSLVTNGQSGKALM